MRRSMLTASRAVVPPNIQFGSASGKSYDASTTLQIAYPSGISAGDGLLVVRVLANDNMTANDISGYTNLVDGTSGTGTANANHTTRIRMDFKVATGSESGELTTTAGGTASVQAGVIIRYTNDTGLWDVAGVGSSIGADTTHGGNRATGSSGNLSVTSGDLLVAGIAIDVATFLTMTSPAITVGGSGTGVGTKTIRYGSGGTTTGNDANVEVVDAPYTGSTQTAALAMTFSSGIAQCGPIGFVRLRQA